MRNVSLLILSLLWTTSQMGGDEFQWFIGDIIATWTSRLFFLKHARLLSTGYSPICPPCDNEMKTDAMLEHMCASEFGKHPPNIHCANTTCEIVSTHITLIRLDMYHSAPWNQCAMRLHQLYLPSWSFAVHKFLKYATLLFSVTALWSIFGHFLFSELHRTCFMPTLFLVRSMKLLVLCQIYMWGFMSWSYVAGLCLLWYSMMFCD